MHDAACISDLVTKAGSRFLYSHSKVTLSLFKLQKRKVILLFPPLYFLISVCVHMTFAIMIHFTDVCLLYLSVKGVMTSLSVHPKNSFW